MFLKQKLDEVNLRHLDKLVREKMSELRCDFTTLCRVAYVDQFGVDPCQDQNYINWKQHGIVPTFLQQWLC